MPTVAFESLPADARVWVFASDALPAPDGVKILLRAVDGFLGTWNAHGNPLRSAHAWRDGRFLAIGVDQSTAGASGCSIDGLFRIVRDVEREVGARLLPGGLVFWRDESGAVMSGDRAEFARQVENGGITPDTHVFDTTVTTVGDWRNAFERPARDSWHGALLAKRARAGSARG